MAKSRTLESVEQRSDQLMKMSQQLWDTPELGLQEHESAETLIDALEEGGFTVQSGVGGMPTAFVASYGDGDSTIGILGEFDALPGLSQKVTAEQEPVEAGAPGHGCGHNLFGVAGVGAALAIKDAIDRGDLTGTIRFYGCPAEETLVGKVFMTRAGVFDDLDAALTWHPSHRTTPQLSQTLALDSVQFHFEGTSAHAAIAPSSGRSALDAVELMNTGVEFMREHVPEKARIHYSILDGGDAPNVVPAEASVWYYVRAPEREQVDRISSWITDIAEGAAKMTQTDVERRYITGCWDYLPNEQLTGVIWDNMNEIDELHYSESDHEFAQELKDTLDESTVQSAVSNVPARVRDEMRDAAIYSEPIEPYDKGEIFGGSTDVGDVSWITPTAQFRVATWPVGTPAHTWQAVAANGDFGKKGLIYAAKVLAGTTFDLLDNDSILSKATTEFEEQTSGDGYSNALPDGAEPPFDAASD